MSAFIVPMSRERFHRAHARERLHRAHAHECLHRAHGRVRPWLWMPPLPWVQERSEGTDMPICTDQARFVVAFVVD